MADPFSIIAGSIGLLDVCWRFAKFLKRLQAGASQVDDEIVSLSREVKELTAVTHAIQGTYKGSQASLNLEKENLGTKQISDLWRDIACNITDSRRIIEELEVLVNYIAGRESVIDTSTLTAKINRYRKQLRRDSKEDEFSKLQSRLKTYYSALQLRLSLIIVTQDQLSHAATSESLEKLDLATGKSLREIQYELVVLQQTIKSFDLKLPRNANLPASTSSNEHFDLPQSVEKNYTGRTSILQDVRDALTAPSSPDQDPIQRRIVVYGVGGSGKTQFCCKYAQSYRQSYWGIFWINVSSDQLAEQTFKEIAKIGKVDESIRAAKHWLSNRRNQWLLIIDNADDVRLDLQKYFPEGERGHVLITTRVPSNKRFGTVGSQALHFDGLKDDDASSLLLKTATTPTPWDTSIYDLATSITKALGYLPLALIHAGKAIMNRLCKLEEYLNYYKIERQRVREAQGLRDGDNIYMNVYSSFEINLRGLQSKGTTAANNAVQLLQLFSFFHNENIRVDFLAKAATNPAVERSEQDKEKAREASRTSSQTKMSWPSVFKQYMLELIGCLYKDRTPPILPVFLRDSVAFDQHGVNEALYQLSQLSLITYNEINDSYSMHPVVHTWARERPEFHIIEQAVWCWAALTTLAQCILLPPLASAETDEQLRRDLLPHIDHAREQQREIDHRIKGNRQHCKTAWLHGRENMNRVEIGYMARFSRVYAQGGKWDEALRLQLSVKDFCSEWLGPNHDSTMRIKLALSGTYWQLGRGDEAAELQEQVLNTCERSRGDKDPTTLKAMDTLGESRFLQGRYTDSLKLHERAYKGSTMILGPGHQDTLKAAKNLGRGYAGLWQLEQARVFLKRAVNGMIRNVHLGPTHLDTLIAMEDLAMTYMEDNGGSTESTLIELEQAYKLMTEVFAKREKKLGKEHPFTLYATLNLARVKAAKGDLEEAESDIRASILIAESILDSQHRGILYAKLHLGMILLKRGHLKESEELLLEVADYHQTRSGEHPDRCKALEVLAISYQLQGRQDEAVKKWEEAINGLKSLKGHGHPYMGRLQSQYEQLTQSRAASTQEHSPSKERDEPVLLVRKAATFT